MRSILILLCLFSLACPGSSVTPELSDGSISDSVQNETGIDPDGNANTKDGGSLPDGTDLPIDITPDLPIELRRNLPRGAACVDRSECGSNYCADRVCCDGTCEAGPTMAGCWRCNLPGKLGECRFDQNSCAVDAGGTN